MAKPTVATVIKWLRLRGEQDRADAIEQRISELEVDRDFWKSAFKKRTAIMDQQEGRIRELLAALAALRGENDE